MWFRRKPKPDPAETVRGLRQQALSVDAEQLGLATLEGCKRVWGVLMETGYAEAVATLVALADGTTSLYVSNGGGVIGAGEHHAVRAASNALLHKADTHLGGFAPATATPPPEVGRVRFYVRTFDGTLVAEAEERTLGEGRHPLSPVFYAAHAVIAAVAEAAPS
jgi:hypothetical protein